MAEIYALTDLSFNIISEKETLKYALEQLKEEILK